MEDPCPTNLFQKILFMITNTINIHKLFTIDSIPFILPSIISVAIVEKDLKLDPKEKGNNQTS